MPSKYKHKNIILCLHWHALLTTKWAGRQTCTSRQSDRFTDRLTADRHAQFSSQVGRLTD